MLQAWTVINFEQEACFSFKKNVYKSAKHVFATASQSKKKNSPWNGNIDSLVKKIVLGVAVSNEDHT